MASSHAMRCSFAFLARVLGLFVAYGQSTKQKPNIVFILTDDQDRILGRENYTELGSVSIMPTVRRRLMDEGAWFDNFFVNTPICCPSRTEFFTGRYFHNLRTAGSQTQPDESKDPELVAEGSAAQCMHADTTSVASREHGLFGLLTAAGYNTGIFGKTTNNQKWMLDQLLKQDSVSYVDSPIDFNNFEGLPYYKYNGTRSVETLEKVHPRFGTTYQTAQIGNRSLAWLEEAIEEAEKGRPFFAYLGFHAPHFPAEPAPWHRHLMGDVKIPVTPNYNLSCPDKAQHVRQNPAFTQRVHCWENAHFRNRWLSLLAVDDVVAAILQKLEETKTLENTYIFYTSDHGYKQGQWRIGTSKQHPYETDVRIPFMVRGPGISPGSRIPQVAGNVDLLPTMLDLAGVSGSAPTSIDGRSLAPLVLPETRTAEKFCWRSTFLMEYLSVGTYFNDHSQTWDDGSARRACGGPMPNSPEGRLNPKMCKEDGGVGTGRCYFVDSTHSNSWRALRVLNETHNLQYVEYDPTWTFKEGYPLQHYELYDLSSDPFQVVNLYEGASQIQKAALHAELAEYYKCQGAACHGVSGDTAVSKMLI
eukprot:TRINITY_DN23124_c0_g1_i1.p1 TRINITY_DN23124_c0_g1~~TRINITY_DN23124_c0_g1_i1.p1  ORF type:complete len:587 (-),score=30.69 TRINITY_DN23124_c0_g1_i1:88-1848(-)